MMMPLSVEIIHSLIDANRLQIAEKALRELILEQGASSELCGCSIRICLLRGKNDEALDLISNLLKKDPEDAEATWYLPQVLNALGRGDEALALIEQLLSRKPEEPFLHALKAQILWSAASVPSAQVKASVDQALRLKPDHPLARVIEFAIARNDRQPGGMIGVVKEMTRLSPESESTAEILAQYISDTRSEGMDALLELVRRFPQNLRIRNAVLNGFVIRNPLIRFLTADGWLDRYLNFFSGRHRQRETSRARIQAHAIAFFPLLGSTAFLFFYLAFIKAGNEIWFFLALWLLSVVSWGVAALRASLIIQATRGLKMYYARRGLPSLGKFRK
jgi:tetratricopeptide (TPR) repeat protein